MRARGTIRRADPSEARTISDLALRSKGHWGYSEDFLEACREELTLSSGFIADNTVFAFESDGEIVGFYALEGLPPEGVLRDLFVDPPHIGGGIGAALWDHALGSARSAGFEALTIDADPNAEPFYVSRGAVRIGEAPSGSIPGRLLPLLRVDLGVWRDA
jgi:GNAT superfamily N-acetyltransferase